MFCERQKTNPVELCLECCFQHEHSSYKVVLSTTIKLRVQFHVSWAMLMLAINVPMIELLNNSLPRYQKKVQKLKDLMGLQEHTQIIYQTILFWLNLLDSFLFSFLLFTWWNSLEHPQQKSTVGHCKITRKKQSTNQSSNNWMREWYLICYGVVNRPFEAPLVTNYNVH